MSDRPHGWLTRQRRKIKARLREKANDSPLLRLLLYKPWFRLACFAIVLLGIVLVLMVQKLWRTSPPGFLPVVKVRGLDFVQAWSLKRAAHKAQAAGQIEEALHAWRGAVGNNPGDPEALRGFLGALIKGGDPKEYTPVAVGQSFWLLRLTRTNQVDAELVTQLYEKYRLDELTLGLLDAMQNRLSPALQARYVRALFNQRDMYLFKYHWERGRDQFSKDPDMALYMAAFQAGWGKEEAAAQGREQLRAAMADPARKQLACRLQLAVSLRLAEVPTYEQALQQLTEQRADTPLDHVNDWALLSATGHRAEAAKKAQAYINPPTSAAEIIGMVNAYTALGLRDSARQLLQSYAGDFGYSAGVWMVYADLLISDRQWDPLAALALQIRQNQYARNFLPCYASYLEGRAALGQLRQTEADRAFKEMVLYDVAAPYIGLTVARSVLQLGYPERANELLAKMEKDQYQNPQYWLLAFEVAFVRKNPDQLLTAATRLYELNPKDSATINNYAAALVVLRRQPEEAVRLTLQVLTIAEENLRWLNALPDEGQTRGVANRTLKSLNKVQFDQILIDAQINHSRALAMNQRTAEAQAILESIRPEQLARADETTAYYMAWLEIYLNLRQPDQARKAIARIDSKLLFPNQKAWLDQIRRQVSPPPAASASAK